MLGKWQSDESGAALHLEEWNSAPEGLLWLLFVSLCREKKVDRKDMRVTDEIIVVQLSPVIFPANEMSSVYVGLWPFNFLLKEDVVVGGVCM